MCVELPGRVVDIPADRDDVARVDVAGVVRPVYLGLLDGGPPSPGEWLSIHLGFAIARMTEAEATEAIALAQALDSDDDDFAELFAGLAPPTGPGAGPTP